MPSWTEEDRLAEVENRALRVHATLIKSGASPNASPNVLVGEPPRLSPLFLAWAQDEGSHEMNCLLGVRADPA